MRVWDYTLICYFSSSFVSFHAAMLVAVIMCLELLYEIFFKIIFYLKIYIKIIFLFIFKINILKLFKNTKKNQLDAFHVKCIFRKHQKNNFKYHLKNCCTPSRERSCGEFFKSGIKISGFFQYVKKSKQKKYFVFMHTIKSLKTYKKISYHIFI